MRKPSHFEALFACIRSGGMTEAEIAAELRDPVFLAYYKQRTP